MKNCLIISAQLIFLAFASASLCGENLAHAQTRPYDRALVLTSFMINTPMFLGILQGLDEQDANPDVIVTCCGGSIAGAIAKAFPSMKERVDFVKREEYYNMLSNVRVNALSPLEMLAWIGALDDIVERNSHLQTADNLDGLTRELPRKMFSESIVDVRGEFQQFPELNKTHAVSETAWVAVATRIEFPVSASGEYQVYVPALKKYLREVYFTDAKTAESLKGLHSIASRLYPNSPVFEKTDVVLDSTIAESLQASISEPVLMIPAEIQNQRFLGGPINMNPVNVGYTMARETIALGLEPFNPFFAPPLEATYGFPPNGTLGFSAIHPSVDHWIDLSDPSFRSMSAGPQWSWSKFVDFNVPDTYDEYLKLVEEQMEFGRKRALEALEYAPRTRSHLRNTSILTYAPSHLPESCQF